MVYADWECSLLKTHEEGKTHRHKANSVGFYFVCTFDSSRNEYHNFDGPDCTTKMIFKLKEIAKDCIAEMRKNTEMYLTVEDEKHTEKLHNVYYVMRISQKVIGK